MWLVARGTCRWCLPPMELVDPREESKLLRKKNRVAQQQLVVGCTQVGGVATTVNHWVRPFDDR
jgi:hypothetical protein